MGSRENLLLHRGARARNYSAASKPFALIPAVQARHSQGVVVQGEAHEQHRSGIRKENLLLPSSGPPGDPSEDLFRRLQICRFSQPKALESFRCLFLCRTHQTFRFSLKGARASLRRLIIFSGSISHEQLMRQWRRKNTIFEMICNPSVAIEEC